MPFSLVRRIAVSIKRITDDDRSNVIHVNFSKDGGPRKTVLTNKEARTLAVITIVVMLCNHIDMEENKRQAMINRIRKGG